MKICENIIIVCYVVLNAILNGVISYFILLHHMVLYQTRLYYIVLHRILNIEYYKKHILYKLYIYILYLYILTINSLYILKIKKQIKKYMLYRLYVYILCIVFFYTIFKFIASKLYICIFNTWYRYNILFSIC